MLPKAKHREDGIMANSISKYSNNVVTNEAENVQNVRKNTDYGRTVGEPKLSDKAAEYYEGLKKKFGNMDFILVSADQKENAKAMASSYANPHRMVVLIDEEKIERMAADENYRAKYEGLIANAASGLSAMKSKLDSMSPSLVKGYGLTINDDGSTDFFAVLKKSSAAQKERIEKKRAENAEAKKAEKKKEAKEAANRRLEDDEDTLEDEDVLIISAKSIEELIRKIDDYNQNNRMNSVMTDSEKMLGSHVDYSC